MREHVQYLVGWHLWPCDIDCNWGTETGQTTTLLCIRLLARNYWTFLRQVIQTMTSVKGQWDQLKCQEAKWVCWLYFTSDTPQTYWLVFMYLSGAMSTRRKWLCSSGDILPLSSREGERPAHTKGSLSPSHCLFLVITSTTIERMGQGEARTVVRGEGAWGTTNRCSLMIIAEKGKGVWRASL